MIETLQLMNLQRFKFIKSLEIFCWYLLYSRFSKISKREIKTKSCIKIKFHNFIQLLFLHFFHFEKDDIAKILRICQECTGGWYFF